MSMPRCSEHDCERIGYPVSDVYGIFAGSWCDEHERNAPGQHRYAGPDTEPLDEDWPNPNPYGEEG